MPARKPDEVHILEGTFRADRHGDPAASVVAGGVPEPPVHLKGEALKVWNELVPLLPAGVAKAADAVELAGMCEWLARYRKVSKTLDRMGATNKKYYQTTVNAGIAWDKFNSIASRFGLTPADRSKLRAPAKEQGKGGVASRKRG